MSIPIPSNDTPLSDPATGTVTPAWKRYWEKLRGGIAGITEGGTSADNTADARVNLGLEIGVDVQAFDSGLASIANLTGAGVVYQVDTNTYILSTVTSSSGKILINIVGDIIDVDVEESKLVLGEMSGQVQTSQIATSAVTFAKIQDLMPDTIIGAASAGPAIEISCTSAARDLLDDVDAATQRATLGLGDLSIVSAPLAIALGGSDATTATGARSNFSVTGMLKAQHIYTSSDTWTKPTNLDFIIVEVIGAGGGGGGCAASGATGANASSGGGAGGHGIKKIAAGSLGTTETVTIGALGAGGSAGANPGSTGGTSSFGSHVSCTGGTGGGAGTIVTAALTYKPTGTATAGGTSSGGDINHNGRSGERGYASGVEDVGVGGQGGDSTYGVAGSTTRGASATSNGNSASGYGAGGGGGADANNAAASGGNGAAGIIIVWEYYL